MEEIDIIELFKRIKEGKAPEEIEINKVTYQIVPNAYVRPINNMYMVKGSNFKAYWEIGNLDTKIKILDKPIIEEIPLIEIKHDYSNGKTTDTYEVERAITNEELAKKINEIIKHINKGE